jgi:L-threonylcarbamoyladenylate synthase
MPRVLPLDPSAPDPAVIAEAASVLGRGGLVAFPTETVYGLGARGLHAADVARIFAAKGRPTGHPLILHVDGEAMARSVAASFPDAASRLASAFWPGPLTIVVPRSDRVPPEASGGLPTVGLRSPAHPVALALIRAVDEPLAAPSANAHMHVSPTTAAHVVRSLGDRVDLVLDGGPCTHGIESTVVATGDRDLPRVLRPGAVSLERLRTIVPEIVYEAVAIEGDAARASPGMASKHYAPRVRVLLASRTEGGGVARAVEEAFARGERVAAIIVTAEARIAAARCEPLLVLPDSPEAYARELFAALHSVDAADVDLVVIEDVPPDPAWWAVADRLSRAART